VSTIQLPIAPPAPDPQRARLVRRARLLAWGGIVWHFAEAAIAIAAGLAASSIALIGFGADSLIEALAGFVVIWRFAARRSDDAAAERRAQQLIAASFLILALYVGIEAIRSLASGHQPETSWVGITLAATTAATMPLLAHAKARVGAQLNSAATASEGQQNLLCAYLSIALLIGLAGNAILDWWWLDPLAALAVAGVALNEARHSWRGEDCCTMPLVGAQAHCADDCCR
jgi:divalent metal cation (Fe/Co/Zn/Cd) transporter